MSGPVVHTIILNWRTPVMTMRATEAALAAMAGIDGLVSVVDNDSGDGSFETMRAALRGRARVRVLQSGRNGGFGAGNNHGIRAGLEDGRRPDFTYILNSDAFPESDAILRLLDHMTAHPDTGLAGSRIEGEDGNLHPTAFRFPSIWSEFEGAARIGPVSRLLRRHVVSLPAPQAACRVDWVAGASLMIRQKALEDIGLFDERFFLYFEETDLCRRAALAGWGVDYVPESRVVHIGSVSTGMKTWTRMPGYWFDSRLWYFTKNHGAAYAALATALHVAGGLLWRSRMILQRRPPLDPRHFLRDLVTHGLRHLRPRRHATASAASGQPQTSDTRSAP